MQVNFHAKTIDQQLSRALQTNGADGPFFQWYLALHIADITQYNAKTNEMFEDKLPYPSIEFPSAPKASLYAQKIHYEQYQLQSQALQHSKQPALTIQLSNCMHPHSLHWSNEEETIPTEIFENCPLHTQRAHLMQKGDAKTPVLGSNSQDDANLSNQWNNAGLDINNQTDFTTLPTDFFVDTTLENTATAAKMVF
jgi:hypothetical protein